MRRAALLLAAAALAAGCEGQQGPVAGELAVRLVAPRASDRGIQLIVTGRVRRHATPPGSAYLVFGDTSSNGDTARVVVVAPAGTGFTAGELVRVLVDDTRQVRHYAARAIALATASYQQGDTSGVSLTVVRP